MPSIAAATPQVFFFHFFVPAHNEGKESLIPGDLGD